MSVYVHKLRKRAGKPAHRYDFMIQGRRYTGAWFPTRRAALDAEAERRKTIRVGDPTVAYSTFRELVDDYLLASRRTKGASRVQEIRGVMNGWFPHLHTLPPAAVTPGHIERALNRMGNLEPSTANQYRSIVSAVCAYGVKLGVLAKNPVHPVGKAREEESPVEPIDGTHLRQLILAAEPPMRALLIFLSQTGARWIGARRLQWSEVTVAERSFCLITTRKTRGGHAKTHPAVLTDTALRAIESQRGGSPAWVFTNQRGGPMVYNTCRRQLAELCERLEIPVYTFHQIRHWAGTSATQQGKSRKAVAKFLGQSSTAATERYMHAADPEMWEVAKRLEEAINLPADTVEPAMQPQRTA